MVRFLPLGLLVVGVASLPASDIGSVVTSDASYEGHLEESGLYDHSSPKKRELLREEAYDMVRLSYEAYIPDPAKRNLPEGYKDPISQYYLKVTLPPEFFGWKQITEEVLVLNYDDRVVVAFSGTDPLSVWEWQDYGQRGLRVGAFNSSDGSTTLGWINEAFLRPYNDGFREYIIDKLKRTVGDSKKVYFTGHSKGGAFATLTAMHLHLDTSLGSQFSRFRGEEGTKNFRVYTFGEPRVLSHTVNKGEPLWEAWHKIKKYRFVNNNDPVPALPTRSSFEHTGKFVFKLYKPSWWASWFWSRSITPLLDPCSASDSPLKNIDYPCSSFTRVANIANIPDHFITAYVLALKP